MVIVEMVNPSTLKKHSKEYKSLWAAKQFGLNFVANGYDVSIKDTSTNAVFYKIVDGKLV